MIEAFTLATFPCNADKKPITAHGFHDAIRGMHWHKAPLVGFSTGAVNGVDVLDIDGDAGRRWYDANRERLPTTRTPSTRRGKHFLFHHAPGLRCSESKIAPGVDVRANGGYAIWWPREGYAVSDVEIAEWPDWLVEEARAKPRKERDQRTSLSRGDGGEGDEVAVESIRAALDQLDPCAFEGGRERWIAFMNGAKAIGAPMELFAEWTSRNRAYQRNDDEIERNWHSLRGLHAGAFYAELKTAGIKFTRRRGTHHTKGESPLVPPRAGSATYTFQRSLNRENRFVNLIDGLRRDGREDLLFWSACEIAGMVLIEDWPKPHVAKQQLVEACKRNGLIAALGADGVERRIENAFRHVEGKLGERE